MPDSVRYVTHKEKVQALSNLQARLLTGFEQGAIYACSLSNEERRAYIARLHSERFDHRGNAK